jgi:hypothetical protein
LGLGVGNTPPRYIPYLNGTIQVSAGTDTNHAHSLVLLNTSQVYSFGDNAVIAENTHHLSMASWD